MATAAVTSGPAQHAGARGGLAGAGAHLLRTGVVAAPAVVAAAALWRGGDGAWSAAFGMALATANLLVSVGTLEWAAGVSLTAVAGVALGGYIARLAAITAVVLLVKDQSWVDLPALGISLVVAHLGLLVWEARSIHLAAEAATPPPERE